MFKPKMDRRIVISTVTETRSASGAATQSLTDLCEVWAEVKYVTGYETQQGGGEQARGERLFRIRWRDDVTAKHVISFNPGSGTELHDILSIAEMGRREGLELRAVAKVN